MSDPRLHRWELRKLVERVLEQFNDQSFMETNRQKWASLVAAAMISGVQCELRTRHRLPADCEANMEDFGKEARRKLLGSLQALDDVLNALEAQRAKVSDDPNVILLPITSRELDAIGRSILLASAFIREDISSDDQVERVRIVRNGYGDRYGAEEMRDLLGKLSMLGAS